MKVRIPWWLLMLLMFTSVSAYAEIRSAKHPIEERYIVRLRDPNPSNVRGHAASISSVFGGRIRFIYDAVFAGFAIEIPKAAAQAMSVHPIVESVEEVEEVYFPEDYVEPSTSYQPVTDAELWHLDRLDERQIDDGGLDGLYAYCIATTVRAYVVDSGVRATHPEFVPGQVEAGFDATGVVGGGTPSDPCPSTRPPGGYHGTAVASVLAGRTTGVAKQTKIVPVRVFDCNGASSTDIVINGLNWILANGVKPAVVNMSFWTADSVELRNALNALVAANFSVFVSANNYPESSACDRAPAKWAHGNGGPVITVGGTMIGARGLGSASNPPEWVDYRWQNYWTSGMPKTGRDQGSCWGPCVDVWAPAREIRVADYSNNGYLKLSGTSFSSPMAAAVAARRLWVLPWATSAEIWGWIEGSATNVNSGGIEWLVRDVKTTPHGRLLYFHDYCRDRPVY